MGDGSPAHADLVTGVAFDENGERALSTSDDGTIVIWDVATGADIIKMTAHEAEIAAARFIPGTNEVISVDITGNFIHWDITTGEVLVNFSDENLGDNQVTALAIDPSGTLLASGGTDRRVKLWNLDGSQYGEHLGVHEGTIWSIAFADDHRLVATTYGQLVLWDTASQDMLYQYPVGNREVTATAVSYHAGSNQEMLIAGTDTGELSLWVLPDLQEVAASLRQ
jgi:WD40 repeat protein